MDSEVLPLVPIDGVLPSIVGRHHKIPKEIFVVGLTLGGIYTGLHLPEVLLKTVYLGLCRTYLSKCLVEGLEGSDRIHALKLG